MGDSVSPPPMTELAPIAEFDKTPPTPPEEQPQPQQEEEEEAPAAAAVEPEFEKTTTAVIMDDLPPPPTSAGSAAATGATAVSVAEEKEAEAHRHYEEENEWGCGSWFEYTLVVVLASILLLGSLALTLFWVIYYHDGFAWRDDVRKQFNLHPVLMVAGFITFSGFSILLYRICRCCRRIYVKLLHTVFHALAIPCVAIGFLAVLDSHNLNKPEPIPNFYSLHSWIGLVTMGLFAIQFIVGFFSFLVLLCCEGATAAFRAALVPIHASFGLTTFMLAIAACLTGLTEKVIFTLGARYGNLPEEGIVMNAIAMVLVALAILVGYILQRDEFRFRAHVLIRSGDI